MRVHQVILPISLLMCASGLYEDEVATGELFCSWKFLKTQIGKNDRVRDTILVPQDDSTGLGTAIILFESNSLVGVSVGNECKELWRSKVSSGSVLVRNGLVLNRGTSSLQSIDMATGAFKTLSGTNEFRSRNFEVLYETGVLRGIGSVPYTIKVPGKVLLFKEQKSHFSPTIPASVNGENFTLKHRYLNLNVGVCLFEDSEGHVVVFVFDTATGTTVWTGQLDASAVRDSLHIALRHNVLHIHYFCPSTHQFELATIELFVNSGAKGLKRRDGVVGSEEYHDLRGGIASYNATVSAVPFDFPILSMIVPETGLGLTPMGPLGVLASDGSLVAMKNQTLFQGPDVVSHGLSLKSGKDSAGSWKNGVVMATAPFQRSEGESLVSVVSDKGIYVTVYRLWPESFDRVSHMFNTGLLMGTNALFLVLWVAMVLIKKRSKKSLWTQ